MYLRVAFSEKNSVIFLNVEMAKWYLLEKNYNLILVDKVALYNLYYFDNKW